MKKLAAIFFGVVIVVVGAGFGAWWFFIRSEAAPRAEIEKTKVVEGGTLDGNYELTPASSDSFVGYRVQEKLAFNIARSTATGRTSDVVGSLSIRGSTIDDVQVTANLQTLKSDRSMRDNAIRGDGLETDRFPQARFVLSEPIELAHVPKVGETVTATARGRLTLHGVTRNVDIRVEGRWDGARVQVVGDLPIAFSDYGINAPNRAGFVSVDDHGEMEFQLFFTPT